MCAAISINTVAVPMPVPMTGRPLLHRSENGERYTGGEKEADRPPKLARTGTTGSRFAIAAETSIIAPLFRWPEPQIRSRLQKAKVSKAR